MQMMGLTQKEGMQIFLRKLHYDMVKSYANFYFLILLSKVLSLGAYSYFMVKRDSIRIKPSTDVLIVLIQVVELIKRDFQLKFVGTLGIFMLMELICYFLVQIWRSNIKRDIKKQFKLERQAEKKEEQDDENTPFLYNPE